MHSGYLIDVQYYLLSSKTLSSSPYRWENCGTEQLIRPTWSIQDMNRQPYTLSRICYDLDEKGDRLSPEKGQCLKETPWNSQHGRARLCKGPIGRG